MSPHERCEARGFTFTELMVVMVLASVVTLGLVTFYLNSQIIWTGASTQVMAQRDATAILEVLRDSIQTASDALVLPVAGDPTNKQVFYTNGGVERHFSWDPADSCVHYGIGGNDGGVIAPTRVERFDLSFDQVNGILTVDTLRVRSSAGERVTLSTSIGLYNQ